MKTNEILNIALIKAAKAYNEADKYKLQDECSHQILAKKLAIELESMGYEITEVSEETKEE